MAKDHKMYDGVELHHDQFDAIIDLENMLDQKIPDITKKPLDPFGFIHDSKKNVTEIRLFRSYFNEDYKIKEIPHSLTNLEYLNTIDLVFFGFTFNVILWGSLNPCVAAVDTVTKFLSTLPVITV